MRKNERFGAHTKETWKQKTVQQPIVPRTNSRAARVHHGIDDNTACAQDGALVLTPLVMNPTLPALCLQYHRTFFPRQTR